MATVCMPRVQSKFYDIFEMFSIKFAEETRKLHTCMVELYLHTIIYLHDVVLN